MSALVLLSLTAGLALGRLSVTSCTDLRDDHATVARQIRSQAQTDMESIDPQLIGHAHELVMSRQDCFSSTEIDEIARLNDLHGPDG